MNKIKETHLEKTDNKLKVVYEFKDFESYDKFKERIKGLPICSDVSEDLKDLVYNIYFTKPPKHKHSLNIT